MPYARRDVLEVSVSADHGGCGQRHQRPAGTDIWEVSACSCADFLRHDPLWSGTVAEIPETPDEHVTREDWAKRGAADRDNVLAMALAKMAGVELPESLTRLISGAPPVPPGTRMTIAGMVRCGNGHAVAGGKSFCGDCGLSMTPEMVRCAAGHANDPANRFCCDCGTPMGTIVPAPAEPEVPAPAAPKPAVRLKDMRAEDLRAMCRDRGFSDAGTRAELISRLKAAQ